MRKLLILVILSACAAACLPPARSASSPAKKQSAVRLTPEQAKKVEQLYYKAVGAYSRNDMAAASTLVKEILSVNPSHKPALELRKKISLALKQN